MPPLKNKRKQKAQRAKKQLKLIESRLMEISLKIDNYIYKNRPISLQDAARFVEEVSSYKYQYGKDARIFQVTEKLIRQLKGVIEEQDTTYSWNVQEVIENSIAVCLPSPTYSDREIDVFQEKDPLDDNNEVNGSECSNGYKADSTITRDNSLIEPVAKANDGLAIDTYEKNTSKRMDNTTDRYEYDTITLSEEDNNSNNIIVTEAQINVCNSPIKDIERSLSQLAIKTVNEVEQQTTSLRTVRKVSQGSKYYNQSCTSLEIPQITSSYHHQDIIVTAGHNEISNSFVPTEATSNSQTIRKIQHIEDTIPQNIVKKRKGRKKAVTKQTELNDSLKPKRRRKNITSKTQQIKDISVNDTKSVPTRRLKNNILINSVIEIPSDIQSDPIRIVYNNNVVNDLSWLENIRYVREIAPEEIDPKLKYYDDSFWDTFDLPANWNDRDFLY